MKTGKTLQELAAEVARQAKTKQDYRATTGEAIWPSVVDDQVQLSLKDTGCFPINELAHDQIAQHLKIPKPYYDKMKSEAPDLLANNIYTWFQKYPAIRTVRTLDTKVRAFLSNSFMPLDNYDFARAILPVLQQRNLEVMSCEVTEKRLYIKAVDQQLFKDIPVGYRMGDGSHKIFDTVAPAVIASNSEVGFGTLSLETGVYTRACTNMALFAGSGMKRRHVGVRHKLLEDVEDMETIMSDKTKQKTNEALWLQVQDLIKSAFDEKTVKQRVEQLEAAGTNKIVGKVEKVLDVTAEKLGLTDEEQEDVLKFLIEGGQLSQYGLHAAITRTAQEVDSYDRATELEYMGGRVIDMTANQWKELQDA